MLLSTHCQDNFGSGQDKRDVQLAGQFLICKSRSFFFYSVLNLSSNQQGHQKDI